jgi:endonuclease/exonuclease/phosphatase family metal-dependent hydrolase
VLTVANFNMHCGIDGWGRPFDYLGACAALDADVLMLEETWNDQAEEIAGALGYQAVTHALAEGRRIRPQPHASATWMPRPAMAHRNKALYFGSARPLPARVLRMARYLEAEPGTMRIALLVRAGLEIEDFRTVHLPTLARDQVRRAALVVDLHVDGTPVSVVGVHMAHIHMGSHRHWVALRRVLRTGARPDAVLAGDMNLWGPPVRAFMSGWHRAVKGNSWPSARPHSQIDHILVRGAWRVLSGEVMPDAGSDHRPVRARVALP